MTTTQPTLLLLHGLGATGSAWGPLSEHLDWDGPVLAPDLPGHGAADRLPDYSVGAVAEAVAADLDGPVAVLGHSFGGAIGVALAGHGAVEVTAAVALGVKVQWSVEDVERFASLAARPRRVLATEEEALERHLAMAGLVGQPAEQHRSGVVRDGDGWRLALDQAALAQSSPGLAGLVAAASAPVALLRGEHDPMVTTDDLRGCAVEGTVVVALPGLGHDAHVQDPAALWAVAAPLLRR